MFRRGNKAGGGGEKTQRFLYHNNPGWEYEYQSYKYSTSTIDIKVLIALSREASRLAITLMTLVIGRNGSWVMVDQISHQGSLSTAAEARHLDRDRLDR